MRKGVFAVVVAVVAVGVAGAVLAQSGPGTGPGMGSGTGPGMGPGMMRGGPVGPGGSDGWSRGMMRGGPDGHGGGWHRRHEGRHGADGPGRAFRPRDFALLPRVDDKKLTTAEVQRVAEGMLLWMGNRTWKVTEVKEAADNQISFALALPEGGVVARFSMDRKTGHIRRDG